MNIAPYRCTGFVGFWFGHKFRKYRKSTYSDWIIDMFCSRCGMPQGGWQ